MAKPGKNNDLIRAYSTMLKIRLFEEKIIQLYPRQEIRVPVHLCIGQEAIAVGVCQHLKDGDFIFSTHRCHGHCIAKGMDLESIASELYGRKTGCCEGKGGSMHLIDPTHGILATSAIVGAGIPLAVGAALSLKFNKSKNIAVAFFGDGAVDEGVFYESLNFAGLKKLPVLFICENNFYATNSPQRDRQPLDNIFEKAQIFGFKGVRCDGNDIMEVLKIAKTAVENMRRGKGPLLLECRTYRWKAHVGPDCDVEIGCRPKYELDSWMRKCPIRRFERYLLKKKMLTADELAKIRSRSEAEINSAFESAKNSPSPDAKEVYNNVYSKENLCPGQKYP